MNLLNFTLNLALQSGEILRKYYGTDLQIQTKKTYRDLVTKADKDSQKFLVSEIKKKFPTHQILAEEDINKSTIDDRRQTTNYKWIIDPLDGTTNFTKNLPIFAISIALQKNDETIIGVVYNPILNQIWFAEKGKNAYSAWNQNGKFKDIQKLQKIAKKLQVSKISEIKNAVLSTGFIASNLSHIDDSLALFNYFTKNARAVRRYGAAALDLCFIASGWLDGHYEYDLCPWDVAAGTLIVQEAGGNVTNFNGSKLNIYKGNILASNGKIHKEMMKKL